MTRQENGAAGRTLGGLFLVRQAWRVPPLLALPSVAR
jgi:hypothetical protein